MAKQCAHKGCGNYAKRGTDYCRWHNGNSRSLVAKVGAKGGPGLIDIKRIIREHKDVITTPLEIIAMCIYEYGRYHDNMDKAAVRLGFLQLIQKCLAMIFEPESEDRNITVKFIESLKPPKKPKPKAKAK